MGNPCEDPSRLEESFEQHSRFGGIRMTALQQMAPEVVCLSDGTLEVATMLDHNKV